MNVKDVYFNIALRSDLETLNNLCYIDKNISKVCDEQNFWIKKFERDSLPLPIKEPILNIYIYEKILNIKNKISDILLVNFIEKNRTITNEHGLMSVATYDLHTDLKQEYSKDIEKLLPIELLHIIPDDIELIDIRDEDQRETFSILSFSVINKNDYILNYEILGTNRSENDKIFTINCNKRRLIEILTVFQYYDDEFTIEDDNNIDFSLNINPSDNIEMKLLRIGIYDTIKVMRNSNLKDLH